MTRENYIKASELIKSAKRILISGHLSPDGDSLGSMIAMSRMLTKIGKEAYASADINAFGKLSFLKGTGDIIPVRKLKKEKKFDLFIAVDCSSFERMPPEIKPAAANLPKICIDHHVTNDGTFGDVQIVDSQASSAAEICWSFAKWMELPIDEVSAEALWVGLITDTGRFAYDSVRPETFHAAADLVKKSVRTALINDIIYNTFPRKSMELKRLAWRTLHIWKNRRVAEVTLARDDFRRVRGTKADAEDIIEIPRSVAHNEIALFFYQIPDRTKETRCSIRTRGDWDATVLAAKFGGGGHRKAAGCTIKAPLGIAKRQMRKAVKDMLYPPKSSN
ncbi:MAG: bifunctional oligoribonuclease/PAP phosphatase NrnA [Kiritimatiellae bacterium]|nr:bifunctional oligoribonuclease/PAP phosphatase NrnA [Kiritimatiellia bacterium]